MGRKIGFAGENEFRGRFRLGEVDVDRHNINLLA